MTLQFRPITAAEFPAFHQTIHIAFGESPPSDEETRYALEGFELERSVAAFENGALVGTSGVYSFTLTVPGLTQIPAAGVSWVGVLPTHRRRGILRGMMARLIAQMRERHEPVGMLMASESSIYGRFGYGVATESLDMEIDQQYTTFARSVEAPGEVRLLDRAGAEAVLPAIYDQMQQRQPGAISRNADWWRSFFRDSEAARRGRSARFYAAYTAPGAEEASGYASYRVKQEWTHGLANSTVSVSELVAESPEPRVALWQFLSGIDLVSTIELQGCPPDDPLRWMLSDPRRLRVVRATDFLWVRLIDVPAALQARRYALADQITFHLLDRFCPENTGMYLLEGSPDGAICRRAGGKPDLTLTVEDLGAAYLGGVRFSTLARAGRIQEHVPGALFRADLLFASEPLPWCITEF